MVNQPAAPAPERRAAPPCASLQRACRLLAAVCALHLGATLAYCLAGRGPGPAPLRAASYGAATRQPSAEPPTPADASSEPRQGRDSSPGPAAPSTARPPPACPEESPLLVGPLRVEFQAPVDLTLVAKENPEVRAGGRYAPRACASRHRVAVVIPFRNRQDHLTHWLRYLHPILQRQQLDYGIYVISQAGDAKFNRAKLLNVGFREASKDRDYGCFVFSDVDLVPMDDRNAYHCFAQPRHLAVAMDKFGFQLPHSTFFGGVSALSKGQFLAINGFPNNYWGWGGEDDDIFNRVVAKGMSVSRPSAAVGKYRMVRHRRDRNNEANPQRFHQIARTKETMLSDGLNTLDYKVLGVDRHPLYTQITVDVGTPSQPPPH